MTYDKFFNKCFQQWWIYKRYRNGSSEFVKTFKTEKAADNWIARH